MGWSRRLEDINFCDIMIISFISFSLSVGTQNGLENTVINSAMLMLREIMKPNKNINAF